MTKHDNEGNHTITAIEGIRVGHATNSFARTGCTVVLCESGAVAGVDVRGSAPGTRETDAIRPGRLVQNAHAILLTGGSAFGLDAAGGVMRYLEERGIGFPAGPVRVPIVPSAVVFDLGVGDANIRPDAELGYQACINATTSVVALGQVGAGTGATVGKLPGCIAAHGGIGSACRQLPNGLIVGAIVVVNAVGNIVSPATGEIIAGARDTETGAFVDIIERMSDADARTSIEVAGGTAGTNTTIGVVVTNTALSPSEITKVAEIAHDGLARAIRPAHTMYDGDTLFALSVSGLGVRDGLGDPTPTRVNTVGIIAAEVVADAIVRAVRI